MNGVLRCQECSSAQQPVQCMLQAEVGSIRMSQVAYILRLTLFRHGVQNRLKGLALRRMGDLFGNAHSLLSFRVYDGCHFRQKRLRWGERLWEPDGP